jgi:hypothetical protein
MFSTLLAHAAAISASPAPASPAPHIRVVCHIHFFVRGSGQMECNGTRKFDEAQPRRQRQLSLVSIG